MSRFIQSFILLMLVVAFSAHAQVTIKYFAHADRFNVNPEINALFEKQNPGIKLQYLQTPQGGADSYHDKLVTMLSARDSSIDVLITDVIWPPELAAAGWLLPLDDHFPKSEQDKYVPAMIDAQTINGKIYGVPYLLDFGALWYRKDILQAGGDPLPKTWMDLVNIAKKHQTPEIFGLAETFRADQQLMCNYFEFLYSNGGQFLSDDGTEVAFDSKEGYEAVQFMKDLVQKHKIIQPGLHMALDETRQIFTQGKAVFHRNWLYVWALAEHHDASKVKGKVDVMLLPTFKEGKNTSTLGGWSFSVNAFTKHKEEAIKAAMFLGGHEAQKLRGLKGTVVPARIPTLQDPEIVAKNPIYLKLASFANFIASRPKSPFYTQMSDIFQKELQEAILDRKSIDEAIKTAKEEIEELL